MNKIITIKEEPQILDYENQIKNLELSKNFFMSKGNFDQVELMKQKILERKLWIKEAKENEEKNTNDFQSIK